MTQAIKSAFTSNNKTRQKLVTTNKLVSHKPVISYFWFFHAWWQTLLCWYQCEFHQWPSERVFVIVNLYLYIITQFLVILCWYKCEFHQRWPSERGRDCMCSVYCSLHWNSLTHISYSFEIHVVFFLKNLIHISYFRIYALYQSATVHV